MKASRLKGKTIKQVHQVYLPQEEGRRGRWSVTGIEFTDGTFLRFGVIERESEYGLHGIYPARGPAKGVA